MNKLTDGEIVKALECCLSSNDLVACWKCPAVKFDICCDGSSKISNGITNKVVDLINRQQTQIEKLENIEHSSEKLIKKQEAEIERLQGENERVKSDWASQKCLVERMQQGHSLYVEQVKSEAIKEFAERLKNLTKYYWLDEINTDDIDNLVKEMTE